MCVNVRIRARVRPLAHGQIGRALAAAGVDAEGEEQWRKECENTPECIHAHTTISPQTHIHAHTRNTHTHTYPQQHPQSHLYTHSQPHLVAHSSEPKARVGRKRSNKSLTHTLSKGRGHSPPGVGSEQRMALQSGANTGA